MKRLILALCLLLPSAAWAQCFVSGDTTKYTHFIAVDETDKVTRETGLSSFTVSRSRNGGATADFTTPTVQEVDSTKHPGVYRLLLDEDMTIGSGNDMEQMVLTITHAGMEPVTKEICIARPKITAGQTLTVSGGNANAAVQSVASNAINAAAIADGAIDRATFATDTNPLFGIVAAGTAQAADSDSLTLAASSPVKPGWTINVIGGSAGVGETCLVESATGSGTSTPVATCANGWAGGVTPTGTIGYVAYGSAPGVAGEGGGGGASIEDIEELLPSNFGSLAISSSGIVQADVRQYGGSNGTFTSGAPTVRLSTGTGTGQISLSSGAVTAGTVNDKTGYSIGSGGITSASFANDAITAAAAASDFGSEIRTGLATSSAVSTLQSDVTTLMGRLTTTRAGYLDKLNISGNVASQASVDTVDDVVDGIKVWTDRLGTAMESDGEVYRFTANALEQAPSGEGGGSNITQIEGEDATDVLDARITAMLATYDPPTREELASDIQSILEVINALHNLSVADIRDMVIEDAGEGVSLGCALAVILADAAGDVTTTGASSTFRDVSGSETRITGTVSSNGNRLASLTCPGY